MAFLDVGKIMKTLDYLVQKYRLDPKAKPPIEIANVGRNDLAQWLHELDFKVSVEVGVAAGEYSQILCRSNPQMKLYGIDPWKPYRGYKDYVKKQTFERLRQEAKDHLSRYPRYVFIEEFSSDAIKRFYDNSLDFVYIDANHREPYISWDIDNWSKKVKKGGIVAGHDYIRATAEHCDVIDAVNRYVKVHNIRPWFLIDLNAKIPGVARDSSRSWMWVKP